MSNLQTSAAFPAHCLAIALAAFAFVQDAYAHTRITTDITWSGEVREVLRKKCMVCHHPGGLAPDYVDLTKYGTDTEPGARAWAVAMEEEILTGRMPPWKADVRFGHFANTKALTDEEKEIIIAWVRGGAPQGPQRDLPTPPEFLDRTWTFGEPDLVFEPAEPFVLAADKTSDSTTIEFPVELEEDTWITGYEFFPENPKHVYSMTAFLHDPEGFAPEPIEVEMQVDYDPLASDEELEPTRLRKMPTGPHFLGQWVRGDQPVLMPDAGGRKLRKGSTIELHIQYERAPYADFDAVEDQSKLGLFVALKNEEIDLLVESAKVAAAPFIVKAGDDTATVTTTTSFDENVHVIGINPHLGPLAKNFRLDITYPDGLTKTAMWIPQYKHLFASSYRFAEPLSAPIGATITLTAQYDNTEDNWDNPNSPPVEVTGGDAFGPARFLSWIDYTLDDHLIVQQPFVPVVASAPEGSGMSLGMLGGGVPRTDVSTAPEPGPIDSQLDPKEMPLVESIIARVDQFVSPDGTEIYWCPMRGNPCELKDFAGPGECPECWMELKTKRSLMEGKDLAPQTAEWKMKEEGLIPIYWCPNRGRPDHSLVDYSQPASCPTCGTPLAHKAQFETQHTWTCVTPLCEKKGELYYGPGLCSACGQPVAGMGHMDHTPVHGGWQFFMADNLYHHLEGTMPQPGLFKLYLYDDWKVPLDARNVAGKLYIEQKNESTGEVTETEYVLEVQKEGDTFLIANVPKDFPLAFYTKIFLAGEEKRFDFEFDELTQEPENTDIAANIRLHTHERVPVEIPPTVDGIVREILRRDRNLQSLMQAKDWFGLHYPAFDAKDFVAALADRQDGLNVRQRGQLKTAIGLINRGANALDRAGDMADEPRVTQAYETFKEGVELLKQIYPGLEP